MTATISSINWSISKWMEDRYCSLFGFLSVVCSALAALRLNCEIELRPDSDDILTVPDPQTRQASKPIETFWNKANVKTKTSENFGSIYLFIGVVPKLMHMRAHARMMFGNINVPCHNRRSDNWHRYICFKDLKYIAWHLSKHVVYTIYSYVGHEH